MDRGMYELIRHGQRDAFIPACTGTETLFKLSKTISLGHLAIGRGVKDLTIEDLNTESLPTPEQPFYILAMTNYGIRCNPNLLMKMATEPDLSNNMFTHSQITELIRTAFEEMDESCAEEIYAMFTVKKSGITRNLLACIYYYGSGYRDCTIYDLDAGQNVRNDLFKRRSVVIKIL